MDLITPRLILRVMTAEDIAAILEERRQPGWAADYPTEGDRDIAGHLDRNGLLAGDLTGFNPRLVIERSTGETIGGIGFLGAPDAAGSIELGYGLAASRRGQGYATEAAQALIAFAFSRPEVREVIAETTPDNPASTRVLEKCGLNLVHRDDETLRYRIAKPG